ncbi:MAG TPA: TIGR00282 family metallophosphoesterase [bacterium]|nr:TIGR00282 family metallophosphoesterase [bacterium]
MNILAIGDVVGNPGRRAIAETFSQIREQYSVDFFIANCENAAAGSGITPKIADEIFSMGVDVITMGDHVWDQKDVFDYIQKHERILRPANYPREAPGKGSVIAVSRDGHKVGVINAVGQVFMKPVDSPFAAVKEEVARIAKETPVIIVDIHAEATSEKIALGWYLDGQVSAVLGTHTHVQTADERIFPKGMAYITDLGMTGPYRSVLGREIEPVLRRFTTQLPSRFGVAEEDVKLMGVLIEVDHLTGKAGKISRISIDIP